MLTRTVEQRLRRTTSKIRNRYTQYKQFSVHIVCEQGKSYKQNSQYDKVLRENMRFTLPGILERVLKLNIVTTEEVKDKIQITKQKEVDALRIITDANGETYVLHLEFESGNTERMNFRMAEYRSMLHQIYDLPVKQYVLYLGKKKSRMSNKIDLPNFKFEYELISLSDLPYELFLTADRPEEQILAVLADFGRSDPTKVIQSVLEKICKDDQGGLTNNKYFEQLRVIIQLRNLETQLNEVMLTVNSFFKKERDVLFKWGVQEGIETGEINGRIKEARKIAIEMKKDQIPFEKISKFTKLTIAEIDSL